MKQWKLKDLSGVEENHTLPAGLPPALVRILLARGIDSAEQLQCFLQPPHHLPYSPLRLSGMEAALRRLSQTVNSGLPGMREKVGIVGDFDVDGITGTAILVEGLADFGIETVPYLPHRVAEGHGLSTDAVQYLAGQDVGLIVTVDCGVSSAGEVEEARRLGMDVIITDHHVPPADPPVATAIINPRVPGNEYPFLHLCGAGLAFKLAQGLYQLQGRPAPPGLLELACLGTIADVVPLLDENRYLVKAGLKELNRTQRPGLQALYRLASLGDKPVTAETVAFQIAPRLNAAGRMGHAVDSLRLLTTRREGEAESLAAQLESQNRQRQDLTRKVSAAAQAQVNGLETLPAFIMVEDPDITPGVAGLVAGRLAETFQRPAVALAAVDGDTLIGSGRSIPAFNLIEALNRCADLFVRHGGHAQAAGFTAGRENISALRARLNEIAGRQLDGLKIQPTLDIDAEVGLNDLTPAFLERLKELEPYGEGNRKPLFLTPGLTVKQAWRMGGAGQHLKLLVSAGRRDFPALAFNRADDWKDGTGRVDLVYSVSFDTWRGREQVNLVVEDFRAS